MSVAELFLQVSSYLIPMGLQKEILELLAMEVSFKLMMVGGQLDSLIILAIVVLTKPNYGAFY